MFSYCWWLCFSCIFWMYFYCTMYYKIFSKIWFVNQFLNASCVKSITTIVWIFYHILTVFKLTNIIFQAWNFLGKWTASKFFVMAVKKIFVSKSLIKNLNIYCKKWLRLSLFSLHLLWLLNIWLILKLSCGKQVFYRAYYVSCLV